MWCINVGDLGSESFKGPLYRGINISMWTKKRRITDIITRANMKIFHSLLTIFISDQLSSVWYSILFNAPDTSKLPLLASQMSSSLSLPPSKTTEEKVNGKFSAAGVCGCVCLILVPFNAFPFFTFFFLFCPLLSQSSCTSPLPLVLPLPFTLKSFQKKWIFVSLRQINKMTVNLTGQSSLDLVKSEIYMSAWSSKFELYLRNINFMDPDPRFQIWIPDKWGISG